jgi:ParB-like chromosome segregation protein Spo0J
MEQNQNIEQVSPEKLIVHPENPRTGDIGVIVQSIEKNGWYGTIVAQRSTNYVLAGNHRLLAAHALNLPTVPVYWVDVDDTTARRIMLADNRASDIATYDDAALADLLRLVQEDDGTLYGTGFDEDDLAALLHDLDVFSPTTGTLTPDIPSVEERALDIEDKGIRSIIIPFAMSEYNVVVERFAVLRKQYGVESNAELILKLVEN